MLASTDIDSELREQPPWAGGLKRAALPMLAARIAIPPPASTRLRAETMRLHLSIEHALSLTTTPAALSDLALFVTGLAPLLDALEHRLGALEPLLARFGLAWPARLRQRQREHDLAGLQRMQGPGQGLAAACPVHPLDDCSEAGLLGALYVVEGSRQGGRAVGQHFATALDLQAGQGVESLVAPGAASLPWPSVCRLLDAALGDELDMRRAIRAAKRTFALFSRALRPLRQARRACQIDRKGPDASLRG